MPEPDWIRDVCCRLLPEGAWDVSSPDGWLCRSCSESASRAGAGTHRWSGGAPADFVAETTQNGLGRTINRRRSTDP